MGLCEIVLDSGSALEYQATMDTPLPTVDQLDREIAALEASVAEKERELEGLRLVLNTLKRAASLRPAAVTWSGSAELHGSVAVAGKGFIAHGARGKTAGSINNTWKRILGRVVAEGNVFLTPDLWALAASVIGISVSEKAAKDWLYRGGGHTGGYVERQGNAYRVSDLAITRFNLRPPALPETSSGLFADVNDAA